MTQITRQTGIFLLFSIFIVSCSSTEEKEPLYYSPPHQAKKGLENLSKRSPSALNSNRHLSYIGADSARFVTKQMKTIIKNYRKIKNQLKRIELKLNRLSSRPSPLSSRPSSLSSSAPSSRSSSVPSAASSEKNTADEITTKETDGISAEESLMEEEIHAEASPPVSEWAMEDPLSEGLFIEEEERATREAAEDDTEDEEVYFDELEDLPEDLTEEEEEPLRLSKESKEQSQLLTEALKAFEKKSYQQAISKLQKYRDQNPDSLSYPQATYYIGKSFEHLKMPLEAEIIFKEISDFYPQSLWAKKTTSKQE